MLYVTMYELFLCLVSKKNNNNSLEHCESIYFPNNKKYLQFKITLAHVPKHSIKAVTEAIILICFELYWTLLVRHGKVWKKEIPKCVLRYLLCIQQQCLSIVVQFSILWKYLFECYRNTYPKCYCCLNTENCYLNNITKQPLMLCSPTIFTKVMSTLIVFFIVYT